MTDGADDSTKPLTAKQKRFVEEYLANGLNATRAAIAVGYSAQTARSQASRMLTFVNIRAEVDRRLSEQAMSKAEVLERLGAMARGDMADFLRIERQTYHPRQPIADPTDEDPKAVRWVEDPEPIERVIITLDLEQAQERQVIHLIKKFRDHPLHGLEVELYDAQAALVQLGKAHKLFIDRTEHSGKIDVTKLSDDELDALLTD